MSRLLQPLAALIAAPALLRLLLLAVGIIAAVGVVDRLRVLLRDGRERMVGWLAVGLALLIVPYAAGHARLLAQRDAIEAGRLRYAAYGDPRSAEARATNLAGWLLDCTNRDDQALVGYAAAGDGTMRRHSFLGAAGANFVGDESGARDYTIDHLYRARLSRPTATTRDRVHPVGADLPLTLCRGLTIHAWSLLDAARHPGSVVVQDVRTGAVRAYVATGAPNDPSLGVKRYVAPGSVFKLALSALWWDRGLPEDTIDCPADVRVGTAVVSNAGHAAHGRVRVPHEMLVVSCNTAAVVMAARMRSTLGEAAFADAYRQFGFEPYADRRPRGDDTLFWNTTSAAWRARMSPERSRIRLHPATSAEEWAQLAIGQGPVDVTVMHVSRFIQAIGNGGRMLPPTFEPALASPSRGTRVMSARTAVRLQQAMRDVVQRGTARTIGATLERGRGMSSWRLGGKTGTAQVQRAPDDGWFAGLVFDPAGTPRYAVVVYLAGGGPGGDAPATIAGALARDLSALHVPPTAR